MSTEQEVKDIITKKKKIHVQRIAKIVGISTGYAIFICQALQRKGEIDYSGGWATLKGYKEERAVEKKKKAVRKVVKVPREKKKKIKKKKFRPITDLKKVTPELAKKLKKIGYKTIEDIAEAPLAVLMQTTEISLKEAAQIINEARRKLRKIKV